MLPETCSEPLKTKSVSNNVMDAAKVQRSANCLLTLDLGVYLGFHQFPLWICERFINVRREADITAVFWKTESL